MTIIINNLFYRHFIPQLSWWCLSMTVLACVGAPGEELNKPDNPPESEVIICSPWPALSRPQTASSMCLWCIWVCVVQGHLDLFLKDYCQCIGIGCFHSCSMQIYDSFWGKCHFRSIFMSCSRVGKMLLFCCEVSRFIMWGHWKFMRWISTTVQVEMVSQKRPDQHLQFTLTTTCLSSAMWD